MVVRKEHVVRQVRGIIVTREKWLDANNLPVGTLMNEKQKEAFLQARKEEFHKDPLQQDEISMKETRNTMCETAHEVPLESAHATSRWHHSDVVCAEIHWQIRPGLIEETS